MSSLPPTFIPEWTDRRTSEQLEYRRLGLTDMFVSTLSLGGAHVSKDLVFSADGSQLLSGYQNVVQSIRKTIQSGINFIDTSPFYGCGKAELVLGKALEGIPRNAYYLATKVGRKPDCTFDYSSEWIVQSFELSLKKLGVDYLDLLHVHDVEYSDDIDIVINETLPALDKLRQQKKVKYIGITGYPLHTLKEIVERSEVKLDVVLSYCRITPFDQTLLQYLPFFKDQKLGVINAAVLGMGLLTPGNHVPYWHAAHTTIKEACSRAVTYCNDRNVNIAKLSVYYALQQKGIDTHLIGMEDENALKANLEVMINGLNEKEKAVLQEITTNIFSNLDVRHWEGVELKRYRTDPKEFQRFLLGGKP
ncbi:unnamed protein product [Medioppia subpectinata]|uniref:NADP-dependent oxidoreductase domain-containing protein n=1 Tax=Medioppia subpectinata TaxID=1979941 RepID=A0A7R9KJ48_9ACAR|nr:unnamed protein product [Medioppia subpectinata]CAG2104650.1 unnamed protein product [Medioppia subpectinata]